MQMAQEHKSLDTSQGGKLVREAVLAQDFYNEKGYQACAARRVSAAAPFNASAHATTRMPLLACL